MTTLEELYIEADTQNIRVDNFLLHNKKAFALKLEDGERAIVLDKTKIESVAEEKELMAEELGHQTCDAMCFIDDYFNPLRKSNIRRAEYKAMSWAYQRLIPFDELKTCIIKEKDLYLVAEVFGVTYDFIVNSIRYYKRKGKYNGEF